MGNVIQLRPTFTDKREGALVINGGYIDKRINYHFTSVTWQFYTSCILAFMILWYFDPINSFEMMNKSLTMIVVSLATETALLSVGICMMCIIVDTIFEPFERVRTKKTFDERYDFARRIRVEYNALRDIKTTKDLNEAFET